jgi:hypothetical protein
MQAISMNASLERNRACLGCVKFHRSGSFAGGGAVNHESERLRKALGAVRAVLKACESTNRSGQNDYEVGNKRRDAPY